MAATLQTVLDAIQDFNARNPSPVTEIHATFMAADLLQLMSRSKEPDLQEIFAVKLVIDKGMTPWHVIKLVHADGSVEPLDLWPELTPRVRSA
jgi:hypothetical protein